MNSQNKQPEKKPDQGDLAFKSVDVFKSPAFYFLVLLVPIFLGIVFTFTAKPPPERPVAATAPAPAEAVLSWGAPVANPAARIQKMGRAYNETPPVPGGRALPKTGCALKDLIGKKADMALVERLKATGRPYRRLAPGAPMTMDYSKDRINLETDNKGVIRRVWCG